MENSFFGKLAQQGFLEKYIIQKEGFISVNPSFCIAMA